MRLVWKLLRQHISLPQLAGFFFANLCASFHPQYFSILINRIIHQFFFAPFPLILP